MSGAAALSARAGPLRVFVSAADAARGAALIEIVSKAGHELVTSVNDADVVLSDSNAQARDGYLVVNLGGDDHDQAGFSRPTPMRSRSTPRFALWPPA